MTLCRDGGRSALSILGSYLLYRELRLGFLLFRIDLAQNERLTEDTRQCCLQIEQRRRFLDAIDQMYYGSQYLAVRRINHNLDQSVSTPYLPSIVQVSLLSKSPKTRCVPLTFWPPQVHARQLAYIRQISMIANKRSNLLMTTKLFIRKTSIL
jgi:hypothetical protein